MQHVLHHVLSGLQSFIAHSPEAAFEGMQGVDVNAIGIAIKATRNVESIKTKAEFLSTWVAARVKWLEKRAESGDGYL